MFDKLSRWLYMEWVDTAESDGQETARFVLWFLSVLALGIGFMATLVFYISLFIMAPWEMLTFTIFAFILFVLWLIRVAVRPPKKES